jgi:hypothetical protein
VANICRLPLAGAKTVLSSLELSHGEGDAGGSGAHVTDRDGAIVPTSSGSLRFNANAQRMANITTDAASQAMSSALQALVGRFTAVFASTFDVAAAWVWRAVSQRWPC